MDPQEAVKNAGAEPATMVGGVRSKPSAHVSLHGDAAPEMNNLLMGREKASDNVIMHNQAPAISEPVSKHDLRDIANHAMNKPAPKLQPSHANKSVNMPINQPM